MLICRACQIEKPDDEFAFRIKTSNIRHKICRVCSRLYSAEHYQANADIYKRRAIVNGVRRRDELHRKLFAYLSCHPCVECGEADPIVLDPDHRDPCEKTLSISRMWYNGYSWTKILQEIEKCDIRCANCHRRRTARQQGWSNLTY